MKPDTVVMGLGWTIISIGLGFGIQGYFMSPVEHIESVCTVFGADLLENPCPSFDQWTGKCLEMTIKHMARDEHGLWNKPHKQKVEKPVYNCEDDEIQGCLAKNNIFTHEIPCWRSESELSYLTLLLEPPKENEIHIHPNGTKLTIIFTIITMVPCCLVWGLFLIFSGFTGYGVNIFVIMGVMTQDIENSESDFRKQFSYPLIKTCDMNEEMRVECVEFVVTALEKYPDNMENACKYIKECQEAKFSGHWHVVVGEGFGFDVHYEIKNMLYMFFGNVAILVFKAAS